VSVALPADARRFQGARAGVVSRLLAAGIDLAAAAAIVVGLVAVRSVWSFFFSNGVGIHMDWPSRLGLSTLGGAALFLYLAWGWARTGKTLGKRVLGLALVRANGGRVPAHVAVARAALYVIFPVGLLWCSVSANQRSVQDLVLRTAVVYDWRGARRRWRRPR
jgi:uncharacterized RDD family membrane protein YckC